MEAKHEKTKEPACQRHRIALACMGLLVALGSSAAHAALIGPVYPAPGGNTFSTNGVAFRDSNPTGPSRIATYAGFDPSAYGSLYFGVPDNNSVCISLDGNTCSASEYLHPDSNFFTANNYSLSGSSTFLNGFTNQYQQATTHMSIYLYDSANNAIPWVTGASLGLSTSDFVADVTAAAASGGFHYVAAMQVCVTGGSCGAPGQQYAAYHMDGGGLLQTSVATAFFATAPAVAAVPEPGSLALIGIGLLGVAARQRRKKHTAA
jgi:hypothetical protein